MQILENSCLVEQDEEPPHNLDKDAKELAYLLLHYHFIQRFLVKFIQ